MMTAVKDEGVSGLAGVLLQALKLRGMTRQTRTLRVTESLALGGRKHLHLVTCGAKTFLVGTGADSVQCVVPVNEIAVSE